LLCLSVTDRVQASPAARPRPSCRVAAYPRVPLGLWLRHLLGLAATRIGVLVLGACIWELVVQGLYRYIRNSMDLSVTVIVLGYEVGWRSTVRDQLILGGITAAFVALLCGCAASTQSSAAADEPGLDCSFRSPTTCWTVSGRFPAPRPEPAAAPLDRTPRERSAALASGADSARSIR
jgi:hypothetical protein